MYGDGPGLGGAMVCVGMVWVMHALMMAMSARARVAPISAARRRMVWLVFVILGHLDSAAGGEYPVAFDLGVVHGVYRLVCLPVRPVCGFEVLGSAHDSGSPI